MYTYYNVTDKLNERFGCMDHCVYVKEGTEDKYCFAPGLYKVTCDEYFCGPPECKIKCQNGQKCAENPEIVCVQAPCCARWSCESDIDIGYLTINESGILFNQTDEDTPEYLKISVPAHNQYAEAVVFYVKETSMRVSWTQGWTTAARVEPLNTTEVIENVKNNEGKVIDASEENKQYFVESVTDETIPEDQRPVDIAPDTPIFRSSIREVSKQEYEEAILISIEMGCVYINGIHYLTIRISLIHYQDQN